MNTQQKIASLCTALISTASFAQPNIILIMADDMGWADTSNPLTTMGNPSDFFQTPTLERLATEGMAFTNAYASPTCAPTRTSILSGAYAPRSSNNVFQVGSTEEPANALLVSAPQGTNGNNITLPTSTITHAETVQGAGYTTATLGKFHVTQGANQITNAHGFDFNYGGVNSGGPSAYHAEWNATAGEYQFAGGVGATLDVYADNYTQSYVDNNIRPYATDLATQEAWIDALVGTEKHVSDALADAAISFMDANNSDPFFFQMNTYAVHSPTDVDQARNDLLAKYDALPPGTEDSNTSYAALLEGMDQSVARVIDYLETTADPNNPGQMLDQNTLVIFYSDNGGARRVANNGDFAGNKGSLSEGGIRVPMIAWSGSDDLVDAGTVNDEMVMHIDFYPTFASLAGATLPTSQSIDGVDLSGLMAGDTQVTGRDAVFWHQPTYSGSTGPQTVMHKRIGQTDWKVFYHYEARTWELYHLDADIDESSNLAATEAAVLQTLGAELLAWLVEMDAPLATVGDDPIQVQLDGIVYAYANGQMDVYKDETLVFNPGDEMPLLLQGVGAGDMNGDNQLTNGDIAAFVMALTDPDAYALAYPGLDADILGDFSGDGALTNGDIAAFVTALTTGQAATATAAPEPSSLALFGLAGLCVMKRRRDKAGA